MEPTDVFGIAVCMAMIFLIYKAIAKTSTSKTLRSNEEEIQPSAPHERDQYFSELFEAQEFVNKNTKLLKEFVISDKMNGYDIQKLAQLNGIRVEIHEGWTDLVLSLMMELEHTGWNRKVGSIKEKFGELRFYAETDRSDILDKYTEKSKTICEICGNPGELYEEGWMVTRCEEHRKH